MIVSLADAKKKLGITDTTKDADVTALINSLTAEIYSITGRSFGEVKTVTDESHDYAPRIYLDNMDIRSVTSIKEGYGTPYRETTTGIQFDSTGRVVLSKAAGHRASTRDFDEVRVSYTFGVPESEVPADLKLAALDLLNSYWKTQEGTIGTTHRVTSISIGSLRKTYAESTDIKARTSFETADNVIVKYTWKLKI